MTTSPIDLYNYSVAVPHTLLERHAAGPPHVLPEKAVAPVLLRRNRFVPSARGMLNLAGAALVGVAAATMFAAPASAWTVKIDGTPICDTKTGTVTVTWSVDNSHERTDAHLTVTSHTPSASTVRLANNGVVEAGKVAPSAAIQSSVPADTDASITIHVTWVNSADTQDLVAKARAKPCIKTSPSPSPAPSRTGGGGGGGAGSPTPSTPGLPVTGPNATIYGGAAVTLLGLGSVLFVVARRRRVRFEA